LDGSIAPSVVAFSDGPRARLRRDVLGGGHPLEGLFLDGDVGGEVGDGRADVGMTEAQGELISSAGNDGSEEAAVLSSDLDKGTGHLTR